MMDSITSVPVMRRVELSDACSQQIKLTIVDTLITSRTLEFRQWWHLAPDAPIELIDDVDFDASTAEGIRTTWHKTWFSKGFGRRTKRSSLCISGRVRQGEHVLRAAFPCLRVVF